MLDELDLDDLLDPEAFDLSADLPEMPSVDTGDVLQDPRAIHTDHVRPPRYVGTRRAPVMYDRAQDLVREIGPAIMARERVDTVLSGNFVFGDFFEAFLKIANVKADELVLSTLSLSQGNVESLANCLRGDYLDHLDMVVSDYWYSHNRQNLGYIYDRLSIGGRFRFAVAGTHTKIALMSVRGRKLVIHGSANLRSSRSVEVMTFEHNPELYDFHRKWHERILANYNTVKGATRASQLFDLIQEM